MYNEAHQPCKKYLLLSNPFLCFDTIMECDIMNKFFKYNQNGIFRENSILFIFIY